MEAGAGSRTGTEGRAPGELSASVPWSVGTKQNFVGAGNGNELKEEEGELGHGSWLAADMSESVEQQRPSDAEGLEPGPSMCRGEGGEWCATAFV